MRPTLPNPLKTTRYAIALAVVCYGLAAKAGAAGPVVPAHPVPGNTLVMRNVMAQYAQLPTTPLVLCLPHRRGIRPQQPGTRGISYPAPRRLLGLGLPHLNINRGLLARLRPRRNTDFTMRLSRNWVYKGDALWFRGNLGFAVVQLPTAPAQPDTERRLRSLAQERQHTADVNERTAAPSPTAPRTTATGRPRRGLTGIANYWLNPETWLQHVEQNRPGVHVTFRF